MGFGKSFGRAGAEREIGNRENKEGKEGRGRIRCLLGGQR
jgi:hypothetical protein